MKANKVLYMGLGGVVALAIAGAALMFSQPTQAAESDLAVLALADVDDVLHPGPNGRGRPGGFGDQSFLLDELGITQEEFDAAREAARSAAIDQAVEAGLLTAEQGERLKEQNGFGPRGLGQRGAKQGIDMDALMAEALGITVEEWTTAKENARAAALVQALADGLITQEQIDLMEAARALRGTIDKDAIMADVLGVSVEEVAAARSNHTLRDLVEESGLTADELRAALQAAHAAAIDQAAADGIITVEQAELLQEAAENGPRGFGPRGRGHHGPRGGAPNGAPEDPSFAG